MTLDTLRHVCLALPGTTEDLKWGQLLAFCIGRKMFAVVNTEPPHQLSFKCTPETFGELIERTGIRPAPYLARAMWVQEEQLGEALARQELEQLIRQSYELVRAKLPKRKALTETSRRPKARVSGARRSRAGLARARRRRR
jgi:predicted DNA-binding protein (MmcQ/YjbR family)